MAKQWIVGIITSVIAIVIAGIVVFLIQSPVQEAISGPKVFAVPQYEEKICPEVISFKTLEQIAPFSVKLQNIGDDGMLTMKISSDELLSRKSDVDEFMEENLKEFFVSAKESKDFKFELKPKKAGMNLFSLNLIFSCYEKVITGTVRCDDQVLCCKYEKKEGADFKLVSQTC